MPVDARRKAVYFRSMVRFIIDLPSDPTPDMSFLFDFVKRCMENDLSAAAVADKATGIAESLYRSHGHEPAIVHLAGAVSFIMSNPEAAKRFWAEAVDRWPDHELSAAALEDMIADDPLWDSVDAYTTIASAGHVALSDHYAALAREAFSAGRYLEADGLAQRISALTNPFIALLNSIDQCRQGTEDLRRAGRLEAVYREIIDKYESYWSELDAATIKNAIINYEATPDRKQLAALVADLVGTVEHPEPVVMELGCFAGFNLDNIGRALTPERRAATRFFGMEPNPLACSIGGNLYPEITFVNVGHEGLAGGTEGLPGTVDIGLISRVLMILHPDEVARILDSLAGTTATLVICDDIFNFDGDGPVIRTPPNFIFMHPFRRLLDEAGFELAELIMAEVPDRECTGFIVARNRNL